jgi:transglutaminase-like putative cysteine protease
MEEYLTPTQYLDSDAQSVIDYVAEFNKLPTKKEQAIALYQKVRDGFLYDPYHLDLRHNALKASVIIGKKRAWCVEKAIVFAAGLRALNIPCRLGYAIVENHIGVDRLTAILRSEKIVFHGYVDVYLDEKWTKATPAFDQRICTLCEVDPLEWTAEEDSLFQAFSAGGKFMEYHFDYGIFNDVPVQLMNDEMKAHYPHLFDGTHDNSRRFSFKHLWTKD